MLHRSSEPPAPRRTIALLAALVGIVLVGASLPGCGPQRSMMPAPLANRQAGLAGCELVRPERRTTHVPVFYATNREPGCGSACGATYEPSDCGEIRVGGATVRIGGDDWDWQRLTRETMAGGQPRMTVTRVEEFGVLGSRATAVRALAPMPAQGEVGAGPDGRFAREINAALSGSTQKDIIVYVPGINIGFDMILQRVAEFSHYFGREGVFIAYAWPAHAHPFSYGRDLRCAADSVEGFTEFLHFLRDRTDARRIHLLTSSAGAPVVSGALAALHARHASQSPPTAPADSRAGTELGQVVYAAPDQDADVFRNMLASGCTQACEHITVYSSSMDLGLVLSRFLGAGKETIGRLPANMSEADAALLRTHAERVTVVDVTEAVEHAGRGDIWAHRYWYANPWVSNDLLAVLRGGGGPGARGLVPARDGALWAFPADYPERVRRAGMGRMAGSAP